MYAGLRRGELRALRWSDVDLVGRMIRVERSWDDHEGEREELKSDAGRRTVPILAPLVNALAEHGLRTGRSGSALVFGRTADEPFIPSTVRARAIATWARHNARLADQAAEEARPIETAKLLDLIGLHEARHTCASTFIAAGANAKTIQTVMGHATIQMTFDRYGHLMPGGLEEAAAAADVYLAGNIAAATG